MRLKLDENLGRLVQELFRQASHDVGDRRRREAICGGGSGRNRSLSARAPLPPHLGPRLRQSPCLQPSLYTGIAVVRLRPKPTHADSMAVTETLILTMVLVAGG